MINIFDFKHDFQVDPSRTKSAIRDNLGYLVNRLLGDLI